MSSLKITKLFYDKKKRNEKKKVIIKYNALKQFTSLLCVAWDEICGICKYNWIISVCYKCQWKIYTFFVLEWEALFRWRKKKHSSEIWLIAKQLPVMVHFDGKNVTTGVNSDVDPNFFFFFPQKFDNIFAVDKYCISRRPPLLYSTCMLMSK